MICIVINFIVVLLVDYPSNCGPYSLEAVMFSGRETLILILHGKIRTTGERKGDMKAKSEKLRKGMVHEQKLR